MRCGATADEEGGEEGPVGTVGSRGARTHRTVFSRERERKDGSYIERELRGRMIMVTQNREGGREREVSKVPFLLFFGALFMTKKFFSFLKKGTS